MNLISLQNKQRENCKHLSILIDENLWYVECAKCKEKLNPIYWLSLRAREQDVVQWHKSELEKHVQLLENKTRTKCQNCGKYTPIRK